MKSIFEIVPNRKLVWTVARHIDHDRDIAIREMLEKERTVSFLSLQREVMPERQGRKWPPDTPGGSAPARTRSDYAVFGSPILADGAFASREALAKPIRMEGHS
jgi:hypothetical protein